MTKVDARPEEPISDRPTDDRGAAALAERLYVKQVWSTRLAAHKEALAILGERGRFLPDGSDEALVMASWSRLRRVEAAARDVMACGGRFYHDRDCPEDAALRAALESETP